MSQLETNGVVPSQYLFSPPPFSIVSSGNQESHMKAQANVSGQISPLSTQYVTINVNSPSCYLDASQSFLQFEIVCRKKSDGTIVSGTNAPKTTKIGLAGGAIQRLTIRLGETICEDVRSYGMHLVNAYRSESGSRKGFLGMAEGYGKDTVLQKTGKFTVCHGIQSGLFRSGNAAAIPIAHIPNGMSIDVYFADPSQLFVGANAGDFTYTIESIGLQAKLCAVAPQYLARQFSNLAAGRSLLMPFVRTREFTSSGNGSNHNVLTLAVGQVQSLQGFNQSFRDQADIANPEKDFAFCSKDFGLKSWSINAAGNPIPLGQPFTHKTDLTDPTTLVLQHMLSSSMYEAGATGGPEYDPVAETWSLGYSWKSENEAFGSSLDLISSNGNVEVILDHENALGSNVSITSFAYIDSLISLQGGSFPQIQLLDRWPR